MSKEWIKLSIPHLGGRERIYVDDAVESTWIVPLGPYVERFENSLGDYLGCRDVVALSSGTAAIHLGLLLAGVKEGEEVICQSLTFAASSNPIRYIGAKPVFVDSESSTWNISPTLLEEAIIDRQRVTGRYPAAIVVVDLYGMPASMNEILPIANRYGIPVLEDSAEALGSEYDGSRCGTFGLAGVLSFNGNKIITTSGGGALICHTAEMAKRASFLATQARENRPYYYHKEIGYNYRLSNVSAAIGLAQMEVLRERVARRREICGLYAEALKDVDCLRVHLNPSSLYDSNFWLTTVTFDESAGVTPEQVRSLLMNEYIETRRIWRPMHMQPLYAECPAYLNGEGERIFNNGLCLPSSTTLSDDRILHVASRFKEAITRR